MTTKFFVTMQNKSGITAYDEFCGAFDSLDAAQNEAKSIWYHLTKEERENRLISVLHADVPDDEDDAWGYALDHGYEIDLEMEG